MSPGRSGRRRRLGRKGGGGPDDRDVNDTSDRFPAQPADSDMALLENMNPQQDAPETAALLETPAWIGTVAEARRDSKASGAGRGGNSSC